MSNPQDYRWVARNEQGQWCGHWHLRLGRAVKCAHSWERYYRTKYDERQEWRAEIIEAASQVSHLSHTQEGRQ